MAKLTDAEVLELLLSFGTPRRDCKQTARSMLEKFGTIRDVFEASPEILATIPGAGPANIVAIKFIHEVSGKYLEKRLIGRTVLSSSAEIQNYLRYNMESLTVEIFKLIYLDHAGVVLHVVDLSRGSVSSAGVSLRSILDQAVGLNATCLICAHNHPSGRVEPSESDQKLTRRLVHLASLAEMRVLDHIIIGKHGDYFSFRDLGLIAAYEKEVKTTYDMAPLESGVLFFDTREFAYTNGGPVAKIKSRKKRVGAETQSLVAEDGLSLLDEE